MPVNPVLSNRALLLAKVETTYNTDAAPVVGTDAFLVNNADIRMEPNVLERQFYKNSLSNLPIGIGRKLVTCTFEMEVKGSGAVATVPALGKLLRGCGFAQTQITVGAAGQIGNAVPDPQNTGPIVTFAKTAAPTSNFARYNMRVVLGGPSATAKVRVTGTPAQGVDLTILPSEEFAVFVTTLPGSTLACVVDQTNPLIVTYTFSGTALVGDVVIVVVGGVRIKVTTTGTTAASVAAQVDTALTAAQSGRWTNTIATSVNTVTLTAGVTTVTTAVTAILLGASGASVTPTWSGSLVLNDQWDFDLKEVGYHYNPISTGFESMTIYMYYDGTLHRMTGCIGNVQFTCQAGQFGTAQFTFTGQYLDPQDQPLPTSGILFENSRPQQVELAQLTFGGTRLLRAQSFTIDMGIQVNPRESVSHPDGYDGVQYTSRQPSGGLNPEMSYESETGFWKKMALASILEFHARVGTVSGNSVRFRSNSAQISQIQYADRNNNRVYDMQMRLSMNPELIGDDELDIAFI